MSKEDPNIRKELVEALTKSPMLQFVRHESSDGRDLRKMLEEAKVVNYKKGNVILREGGRSDRMYFLTAGTVEVSIAGKPICTLERMGDVFGEIGVIMGEVRSATITALTDVTCLATGVTFANELLNRGNLVFHRVLHDALTRILMGRLHTSNEELAETKKALEETREEMEMVGLENAAYMQEIEGLRSRRSARDRLYGPQHKEKGE